MDIELELFGALRDLEPGDWLRLAADAGDGLATAFITPTATASGAKAARSATHLHPPNVMATPLGMSTERVDRGSSGPAQVGVQEIDFDTGEASRIVNRNTPEQWQEICS